MEQTFKDKTGRFWAVPEITLWHVKQLQAVGIDIQGIVGAGYLWEDISDDAWITVGVIAWTLCQDQHECSEEDFYKSWDGQVFTDAQEAVREAIINFIPTNRREVIKAKAEMVKQVGEMLPLLNQDQVERINLILSESVSSGLEKLALRIPPSSTDTALEPSPGLQPDDGTTQPTSSPELSTCNEPSPTSEAVTP